MYGHIIMNYILLFSSYFGTLIQICLKLPTTNSRVEINGKVRAKPLVRIGQGSWKFHTPSHSSK